jgi:hypothetical protein
MTVHHARTSTTSLLLLVLAATSVRGFSAPTLLGGAHGGRQRRRLIPHLHQYSRADLVRPSQRQSTSAADTGTGTWPENLADRNVETNTTQVLVYDDGEDRFVRATPQGGLGMYYNSIDSYTEGISKLTSDTTSKIKRAVQSSFLPQGVNDSYYAFMRWRVLQRFVNSNLHVLGTQSLIMGLGIKSARSLGVSAALTWVLKDALGKLTRLVWASRMGRRFDSDAKRWRFRASLVYALGNYLEIVTYMNPRLFLLWATIANSCKQVAMLTSSATRTALYNSFRDGRRENIADITAKGEAQIAVVDLLGIAFGVSLSRLVGTTIKNVLATYVVLQLLELYFLFRLVGSVQFRVMNYERMTQVVEAFLEEQPAKVAGHDDSGNSGNDGEPPRRVNGSSGVAKTKSAATTTTTGSVATNNYSRVVPTPEEIARTERIFLPPKHLRRRALAFGSLGRAKLNPDELSRLMKLFQKDRYMLVVGENTKKKHRKLGLFQTTTPEEAVQQNCHIVLHEEATNLDILKSTLALFMLRGALVASGRGVDEAGEVLPIRCSDCWDLLEDVRDQTDSLFPLLLKQLSVQGWASPSRFMFGRVQMRAYWPLSTKTAGMAPS